MAAEVTMPRLSDSMEEGTILRWIVSEGDEVKRGEPLVEIETDKANMTYEADADGTLIEIVAGEGDTLPIGEVIARIGDPGEASSDGGSKKEREDEDGGSEEDEDGGAPEAKGEEATDEDERSADAERSDAGRDSEADAEADDEPERGRAEGREDGERSKDGGERVKASPVAKRMAREMGVELGGLEGSGPGGRIVKADIEAAAKKAGEDGGEKREREQDRGEEAEAEARGEKAEAEDRGEKVEAEDRGEKAEAEDRGEKAKGERGGEEEKPTEAKPAEPVHAGEAGAKGELYVQDLTRMQRTISRRMAESKATAPDFQLHVDIDMTSCVELRERLRELAEGTPPSFNDIIVKACAAALREHPRVNGAYRDGRFELYSRINVGVAVAARDALIVPTVFDADRRSIGDIARTVRALVEKVRDGKITPPELSGATFTVSNLGMYGIDSFSAVIAPPQAAILAVGALKKKPVVDEESGRIVARDMMSATLVCDHRILYGADGAQFLARVKELLEKPLLMAL